MRLLLTVLSAHRSTLGERSTQAFDLAGGLIGRSASCTWSLPDDSNTLSAKHAAIGHNGHGFVVTDTSTNGVYLNSVDAPLGRGQSAPLTNGDTLYIADYIISVAILRDATPAMAAPMPMAPATPMPFPAMPQPAATAFPLDPHTSFGAPTPQADRFGLSMDALLAPSPPPVAPRPAMPLPPQPLPAFQPAPPVAATIVSALQPSPTDFAPPPAPAAGLIPDDFDFSDLMAPVPAARSPAPPVAMQQTQIPAQALPPMPLPSMPLPPDPAPMPAAPMPMAIPDDLMAMPAPRPEPAPRPDLGMAMPGPLPGQQTAPEPSSPEPLPLDPLAMLRQRAIARAASIDLSRPDGTAATPAPAPPPARAPIGDFAMPGGMGSSGAGDADAFWEALGLDVQAIPASVRQNTLAELGSALRETAAGLVMVLSARKSMKDEFRIDQTRLAPQENNPFKFFRSGDEALRRSIVEAKPGYLPLDRAVKQGFDDIQAHEIATAIAMQNAMRKLLASLAPTTIEQNTQAGLLGRRPDKSRLWDRYVELHGSLAGDLDRTMRDMLADEFLLAYAQQTQGNTAENGR